MALGQDQAVALLSVHSEFAQAILHGTKTVELRRRPPKREVSHVVLYETAPTSAIVGWARVQSVETRSPTSIWTTWGVSAGVTRDRFRRYFSGTSEATAIVLGVTRRLEVPMPLALLGLHAAPQNFIYLNGQADAVPGLAEDAMRCTGSW
ncbi:ASCH domain-containing protein [Candidatus Poriferisocius sp.]|uniref:ASCH domain-containing protein n=1 Tax=Candidatus Poriferisocius sp. TaxID=3101276 RepID=UPI003B58FD62